ncbi:ABC transporter ATP-binding protein [Dactylosporangium sp. NPDC051541]|uniref:ABC transporter ATP-binding protein n=1 Tax=Dactylosporangium sp. NPDC051541 TaxID=3363977 RepID=UPI0037B17C04
MAAVFLAVVLDNVAVGVAAAVFAAAMAVFPVDAHQSHLTINALTGLAAYEALRTELGEPRDGRDGRGLLRPARGEAVNVDENQRGLADGDDTLIVVNQVDFTYPGTGQPVLRQINLELRPGERLAIVGLNGAGKSTLIKLLAGLYTPTAGTITAGGVDIADIGVEQWRRRISVVFQDFVRYQLSAADNIMLGNAAVPRDAAAFAQAVHDAGLAGFGKSLPDGWNTPLARARTGGVDLSGGQWQRVVLGRALYAVRTGARLLVLDEPTAHLDVRTEFETFERLGRHRGGATVVLISHRLSTVRQADRIVLLDDGRIAEEGTHDELMALGGKYAAMFAIQAARFR